MSTTRMSSNTHSAHTIKLPKTVIISKYVFNPEIKLEESLNHLANKLDERFNTLMQKEVCLNEPTSQGTLLSKPPYKSISMEGTLGALEQDIEILQAKANGFNPYKMHFTKEYRTLEGFCERYQTELDQVDVSCNSFLRDRRTKCYKKLEKILYSLSIKVHEDGRTCKDCELKI